MGGTGLNQLCSEVFKDPEDAGSTSAARGSRKVRTAAAVQIATAIAKRVMLTHENA